MGIVLDTSAVIAVIIFERQRKFVLKALRGSRWIVAPSLPWEVGSALARMMKARRIVLGHALRALHHFAQLQLESADVDMAAALAIASSRGIHAYDAYSLGVARRRELPLMTLDQVQAMHAAAIGISIIQVPA